MASTITTKVQNLSKNLINQFKEAFDHFDKYEEGTIRSKDLRSVIRSLGQNPTEEVLQSMINSCDLDKNGLMDFPEFLDLMANLMKDTDPEEEIKEAFRVFDKNGLGLVNVGELKTIMMNHSEQKLTTEEVDEILTKIGVTGGKLNYEEFSKLMT